MLWLANLAIMSTIPGYLIAAIAYGVQGEKWLAMTFIMYCFANFALMMEGMR